MDRRSYEALILKDAEAAVEVALAAYAALAADYIATLRTAFATDYVSPAYRIAAIDHATVAFRRVEARYLAAVEHYRASHAEAISGAIPPAY